MLVGHAVHVLEEIHGRFLILNKLGLARFLIINFALFCIPLVLFYFVSNEKKRAYRFSLIYAGFMGLQAIGHNIAATVTGRYFDGFAGGYSGIGLLIISMPLIYYLCKDMPNS